MDRNFFLPIAVAAGVHSFLFISGTPTERPIRAAATIEPVIREYVLPARDPEIRDIEESTDKATTTPPPPVTPDLPVTTFDSEKFLQPVDPRDMIPRPGTPDSTSISSDWRDAVDNATRTKGGLFSIISLDNNPAARFQPAPVYPRELKSTGSDGSVTVTFSVDVNGEVFNATVSRASHSAFGEEALRAVKRWRFEPGIKDGRRVAFRMVQTFSFNLSE